MKTAAVIPAFNEEQTIGAVISSLLDMAAIDEIIVVNDGSEDGTVTTAREFPVTVVDLQENRGKGGAMTAGVASTDADLLLFIDADLVGLTESHIQALVNPVLNGSVQMTVGVFEEGRLATDLAQRIAPFLSGQRAITRELWNQISDLEDARFGVEVSLSRQADKLNATMATVVLKDLSQVMKEEKRGLCRGIVLRVKMYWEILRSVKL